MCVPLNIYIRIQYYICMCVTGYWKTNQNVTLGLFHFVGPGNRHTHTLPVHCCINRLSWLVCFSRAGFVNHVKSQLRQWGPWRELDGGYGCDIHPVLVRHLLLGRACLGLWPALLGLIEPPNSPVGSCNLHVFSCPLTHTHTHPLIHAIHDITEVVKKVAQDPVSYYRYIRT